MSSQAEHKTRYQLQGAAARSPQRIPQRRILTFAGLEHQVILFWKQMPCKTYIYG